VRSFIGWFGGTSALSKTIVSLIPRHTCYVEPFGGAAWVLFAKTPSPVEVYNDLDGRLVELFRTVKHHPDAFLEELQLLLPSREMFEFYKEHPGLTEIQRAARFYFLVKMSFSSLCRAFRYSKTIGGPRLLLEKVMVDVERVRERLERVTIEHDDFAQVLQRYDSATTFFHLSPPYLSTDEFAARFNQADHERLRESAAKLKGKWLLTYNDCKWAREAYRRFATYKVVAKFSSCRGKPLRAPQLVITNYRLSKAQLAAAPHSLRPLRPSPILRMMALALLC